jgi:ketosteroid isomerase-like protein
MGRCGSRVLMMAAVVVALAPDSAAAQFDGPEAQEFRAREVAFAKTMADRDFEAFLTFITPDAVFFAGNRPQRGRTVIGDVGRSLFEGDGAPFAWGSDLVQVMDSGDVAFSSGPVTRPDGESTSQFNSIWLKADDEVWYVVLDKGS